MSDNCLIFKNVDLGYRNDAPVLTEMNFHVNKGDYCGVVGANGSGKSTLLKAVAGLLEPLRGEIAHPFKRVSYLPQNGNFNRTFPISIADVLKMGRFVYASCEYGYLALQKALDKVKLTLGLDCPISNLSGGQFQRVLFARALLQNPDLLLLDEPFNGVDEQTIFDLAHVLADLHASGKTILLAVHDWNFVSSFVPLVLDVKNAKVTLHQNPNLLES